MKNRQFDNIKVRTDLAIEDVEFATSDSEMNYKEFEHDFVKVSKLIVYPEAKSNKKAGLYYNLQTKELPFLDSDSKRHVREVLTFYLNEAMETIKVDKNSSCLVVGLGNRMVTPDALGPDVVDKIMVTKHIFNLQPENVTEGFREVSAIAPGVMGTTGIETYDIIESVVKKVKPDFIIVVDALAAKSIERVNRTIQITDTGISPGSGVGNKRKEISRESLGIPVIAVGVPTVVDAITITSDAIDMILKFIQKESVDPSSALLTSGQKNIDYGDIEKPGRTVSKNILGEVGILSEMEKRQLIFETLTPAGLNLTVTPKEIDDTILSLTEVISEAINVCLHQALQ